jgi:hypothetical protein
MTRFLTNFIFFFVLVFVLVSTGCISQTNTPDVTTSTSDVTAVQTICPSQNNSTPWIIINPIDSHHKNETFEINGSTNLGINEKISYNIQRPQEPIPFGAPGPDYTVTKGYATIVNSRCNEQHWSFLYNSSEYFGEFNLVPIENSLTVYSRNMAVINTTFFPINSRQV